MSPTILVPLDGSPASATALPVAVGLARLHGAALHLVAVDDLGPGSDAAAAALAGVGAPPPDADPAHADALAAAAARVRAVGLPVTTAQHASVDVAAALLEGAGADGVLLVVMTTRARHALERTVIGSVADPVARAAPVPVVLVPPFVRDHTTADDAWVPRRLLVPLDGSGAGDTVLDHLAAAPGWATLARVLLYVCDHGDDEPTSGQRVEVEVAQAMLERVATERAVPGAPPTVVQVVRGDPATAITDTAARVGADLIAMTTRGHGGLRRLALGSCAEGVVRGAAVPVLLTTPGPG